LLLLSALDGRALVEKYECARCHEDAQAAEVPVAKSCVQCHRNIFANTYPASRDILIDWQSRIVSLKAAPSLASVARFKKSWVVNYLLRPTDLRPGLSATMPRLAVSEEEAAAIAETLGAREDSFGGPKYSRESIARGQVLYGELQCAACHESTVLGDTDAKMLAPHLSVARKRMAPGGVREALEKPQQMPKYELPEADALALEAFLMGGNLSPPPQPKTHARLPRLERKVGFDEVYERVFRKTCWHCHSDQDLAKGDGGPGNTGGFGFPPRGLSFASYAEINSGSIGPDGNRRSILRAKEGQDSLLVQHLLARREEEAGRFSQIRGMPLGLPAVDAEQLQLVESWLAQGRPR
jgi:mono/diheme cytochrome c family protein